MFLKILTFSLLSFGLIILSRGVLKEGFKIGVQDVARRFQTSLPSHFRLGSASVTGVERFWTPKGRPKEVHCASPGLPKMYSFKLGLPGSLQNRWSPFGRLGDGFWILFGLQN